MPVYTIEDLAARWQCHPDTIRRMVTSGKLPAFKIGRDYRIRESDILEYEKGG